MFEVITAGIGSILGGGITGLIGAGLTSWTEIKKQDSLFRHDEKMAELDQAMTKLEIQGRLKIAETESQALQEIAASDVLQKSFDADRPILSFDMGPDRSVVLSLLLCLRSSNSVFRLSSDFNRDGLYPHYRVTHPGLSWVLQRRGTDSLARNNGRSRSDRRQFWHGGLGRIVSSGFCWWVLLHPQRPYVSEVADERRRRSRIGSRKRR